MGSYNKIEIVGMGAMKNASVNAYTGQIARILLAEPAVEAEAGRELEEKRIAFKASIEKKASYNGMTLQEIDKQNDRLWRASKGVLKFAIENPDPEIQGAAKEVYALFTHFGDPTRDKYLNAYGTLDQLIDALNTLGDEKIEKALVLSWVKALREGVKAFHEVQDAQNASKSKSEQGVTQKLRAELCNCYADIIDRLNAIAILRPDAAHLELNARISQAITDYRLSQKLGKRKNDEGEEDEGYLFENEEPVSEPVPEE